MTLARLLSLLAPPLCWACGGPAGREQPLCPGCRAGQRWLGPAEVALAGVATWAPVAYNAGARELVSALKFRGAAGVAEHMAAAMVARAPPRFLHERSLVPVPLHPARERRRGFNQADRLAEAIASRAAMPVRRCLRRRGAGRGQVGRGRGDRLAAVKGAIGAEGAAPPRVLLVDDVITTGATLAACAGALRAGGASDVVAIAYARTLGR
jgi:ComF family protein